MIFKKKWRSSLVLLLAVLLVGAGALFWSEKRKNAIASCWRRAYDFQKQGRLSRALRELDETMRLGADKAGCYAYRGWIQHSYGYLSAAERDYKASLAIKPVNADILSNLGDLYYRQDDIDAAMEACNKSLKYAPNNSNALANRAQVRLRQHEYQRAVEDASNALANVPTNERNIFSLKKTILTLRAAAYRDLGEESESEQDLATARNLQRVVHRQADFSRTLEAEFSQKIIRPRFVLCTNGTASDTALAVEFFDRFLTYIDKNVTPVKPDPTFHIFLFSSSKKYKEFLKRIGERRRFIGNYVSKYNAAFTYARSGNGVFAHEVMHKVLEDSPFIDEWAIEGIPALFEEIYGYPCDDNYRLTLGIQSRSRLRTMGDELHRLPLVEVISQQDHGFTESEERLAGVFLFRSGKLQQYLQLCQSGCVGNYATVFETVFGKSAIELEPEWKKYLNKIDSDKADIQKLPNSRIFENKKTFDEFVSTFPANIIPPI